VDDQRSDKGGENRIQPGSIKPADESAVGEQARFDLLRLLKQTVPPTVGFIRRIES
jgi:hypothetical protein